MSTPHRHGEFVVRSRYFQLACVLLAVAVALVVEKSADTVVVACIAVVIGLRCWRIELRDDGRVVHVRNFARSHRIPWGDVTAVSIGEVWSAPEHTGAVVLHTGRRKVKALGTVTYSRRRAAETCRLVSEAARSHGVPCELDPDDLRSNLLRA